VIHHKTGASVINLKRLFLCLGKIPAFHLCCALFFTATCQPLWADTACDSPRYDETTSIKYIHDGDTLHLRDGRKVRLIGINTPEIAHDDKPAEPYSSEAKNMLQALFRNNKTISLVYGNDKHDRYKRLLAHAFTSDGENVQAILLERGVARTIVFPPNTRFATCYEQQERKARCASVGLWRDMPLLSAKNISDRDIGFQLIKGTVKNISSNRKGVWINLDNRLSIGIRPDNQQLFDIADLHHLSGKDIVVRGWLNKNNKQTLYYLRIRHPSSILPLEAFACSEQAGKLSP